MLIIHYLEQKIAADPNEEMNIIINDVLIRSFQTINEDFCKKAQVEVRDVFFF